MSDYSAKLSESFDRFLSENGLTDAQIRRAMKLYDSMPHVHGRNLEVRPSPIEGMGVFATQKAPGASVIGHVIESGAMTPAARYLNHSDDPNARFEARGGDVLLRASRNIECGDEVTVNYRQSISETLRALSE